MMTSYIIHGSVRSDNPADLDMAMEDMEMFLADMRKKIDAKEVTPDENASQWTSLLAQYLMEGYSYKHNIQRCEEDAALSVSFYEPWRSITNYELCRAYIENGYIKEAHLWTKKVIRL